MSGNTFGRLFRLTTFGESHGTGLGGVIDGCPSGVPLSEEIIQRELDARKPGSAAAGAASTARKEPDAIQLWSGVFEGVTTGTPIGFTIANKDQRSRDYSDVKDVYRPGHADYTYQAKYGVRDYRGGGRSSGRETASRVAGGAVAGAFLANHGVQVLAYTLEMGSIPAQRTDPDGALDRPYFSPDADIIPRWEERLREVRGSGDSIGGVVEIIARGVPAGLGEPVFDKLDARLAGALMSVGAVKGVEIGLGAEAARVLGSENNDEMCCDGFLSNNAGGILGGISNGDTLIARAYVKPIPSIAHAQRTVDACGGETTITVGGRHDCCAIPRIVPVLAAMVKLTIADMWLLQRAGGRPGF